MQSWQAGKAAVGWLWRGRAGFGLDKTLRERDEGQEKVYINQRERKAWATQERR